MSRKMEFYNSLSKKKELFTPVQENLVRIYHCGPTVYKRQHLGNMRRFLFADFLGRAIEYFGYELKDVTNITDVGHLTQDDIDTGEDKLEKEASIKNVSPQEIADRETKQFMSDLATLNIRQSGKYPRATEHIKAIQDMVGTLIEKGYAYETEVGVFYDISKFDNYGKLSGNTTKELESGARLAVRSEKRNPGDFALWLTDKPDQLQQWDSPWGRGYPGWHIECSAMSLKYLGAQIDIHTGGEDNKFPHHENEIAQSEAATGKKFVNTWMHNAHLQMSGKKLAKREGQQLTVDTIIEKGYSPIAFRLMVFGCHYRSKIDFSWRKLGEAEENLKTIERLVGRLSAVVSRPKKVNHKDVNVEVVEMFGDALADDLNTPRALAVVYDFIKQLNKQLDDKSLGEGEVLTAWNTLLYLDSVLGIIGLSLSENITKAIPNNVEELLSVREEARINGDFEKADELRKQINALGFGLNDTSDGPMVEKL